MDHKELLKKIGKPLAGAGILSGGIGAFLATVYFYFPSIDIEKLILFMVVSTGAMVYAYAQAWMTTNEETGKTLWQYLTGNTRAIAMSFSLLASSWMGAGAFSYLENNTPEQLIGLAIAAGMGIPAARLAKLKGLEGKK